MFGWVGFFLVVVVFLFVFGCFLFGCSDLVFYLFLLEKKQGVSELLTAPLRTCRYMLGLIIPIWQLGEPTSSPDHLKTWLEIQLYLSDWGIDNLQKKNECTAAKRSDLCL